MDVIEVRHLTKRYGARLAVDDVSFSVEEGEILAILGPNGAGKTTTVESISGLRTPDAGTIAVLGHDPRTERDAVRRILGVQLQQSELPPKMRVGEALELFASFYPDPVDRAQLIDGLRLGDVREAPFAALSGGQRQRLSIALALVGRPKVAILDELTTGLDPRARRDTWELIEGVRERGTTILLVSHFMDEAERLADRVAILDRGRLLALDRPAAIVGLAGVEQRVRFRPSSPVDERLLTDLPEVRHVARSGRTMTVSGSGDLVHAVTSLLARSGSARELEVLALVAQGETNGAIASRLFVSEATVKTHLLHIYAKLDVNDRASAVAKPTSAACWRRVRERQGGWPWGPRRIRATRGCRPIVRARRSMVRAVTVGSLQHVGRRTVGQAACTMPRPDRAHAEEVSDGQHGSGRQAGHTTARGPVHSTAIRGGAGLVTHGGSAAARDRRDAYRS